MELLKKYKYWIGGLILILILSFTFKGCDKVIKYVNEKPNKQRDSLQNELELIRDTNNILILKDKQSEKIISQLLKSLSEIDKDKLKKDNEKIKNDIITDTLTPIQTIEYWTNERKFWYLDSIQGK